MDTIHHVCDIGAEPDEVFGALNSESGLRGWWSTRVDYPEPGVGNEVRFTFEDPFHPVMEVTALEDGALVAWRCANEPWLDAEIRFELSPSERRQNGTTVSFWQRYASEMDDESFGIFNYNWGYYLESLRLLLEDGSGRPFEA